MIHVFHPNRPTDQSRPCPVAHTRPPNQKPSQKSTQDDDMLLPNDREGLLEWIQGTVFPDPIQNSYTENEEGSLDLSSTSSSDLDSQYLNDAFGESPGDDPYHSPWNEDSELST
jgi:hypothetical protein